jgi:hypothetical protein
MSLVVTGPGQMRANIMSDVQCGGARWRELRSPLLGGSATLPVTDERRSGAATTGIRFPLSSGVDPRNINSASPGDHFSSTGNMALPARRADWRSVIRRSLTVKRRVTPSANPPYGLICSVLLTERHSLGIVPISLAKSLDDVGKHLATLFAGNWFYDRRIEIHRCQNRLGKPVLPRHSDGIACVLLQKVGD